MKYRITNGLLLTACEKGFSVIKEDLFINGTKIESVGKSDGVQAENYETIDAANQLVMPGLINSHTHVYMNFIKNTADDIPFNSWLYKRIFPIEAKMQGEDFYWSALSGYMEMIKTGTTCCVDMHICANKCAQAAKDAGVRAFMGECITGDDLYSDANEKFKSAIGEKEMYESDLIKFILSPHSVYACSEKLLSQIAKEAEDRKMLKHIHLSESKKEIDDCLKETGKTPVEYLDGIGFLDSKTIAAHCVKVNEKDIEILSQKKVNVATNPSSNAKLGNGIAPVGEMLRKGVNVCLATDSAASNNTLNMFREMGIFSLIHKAVNESATDFSAKEVLRCATINPAKALGMENEIAVISKGAYADLIFVDLQSPSLFPNNDIVSSLCYTANGSEVSSVMINGNFVLKNRIFTEIDTEQVYYQVEKIAKKYIQ